jgi:hypothetical protein
MNATKIFAATFIAAAAFATTHVALAQEATYEYPTPAANTVTRAQVQQELAQARRDGSMRVWSASYNHMAAAKSLKTRDEVRAEALADHRAPAGTLSAAALSGEDSGSFAFARQAAPRATGLTLASR